MACPHFRAGASMQGAGSGQVGRAKHLELAAGAVGHVQKETRR